MKSQVVALLSLAAAVAAFSQSDDAYAFGDEAYELSPFTVSGQRSSFDPRQRGGFETTTPVRLVKRADAVALKLTVSAESAKPEERIADLQAAYAALRGAAERDRAIDMKTGYVALPLVKGRSYALSSKTADEVSSFDVTLVAKLGEADSVFERVSYLNAFIDGIALPRNARAYFVSSGIALMDADRYRPELIKMIGAEHRLLEEAFGDEVSITLQGLDQRVRVGVLDDARVEIFIPYRMEVRVGGAAD